MYIDEHQSRDLWFYRQERWPTCQHNLSRKMVFQSLQWKTSIMIPHTWSVLTNTINWTVYGMFTNEFRTPVKVQIDRSANGAFLNSAHILSSCKKVKLAISHLTGNSTGRNWWKDPPTRLQKECMRLYSC